MSMVFDVKATQHYTIVPDPDNSGYFLVVIQETNEALCQCDDMFKAADIVRALEVGLRLKHLKLLGF